MAPNSDARKTEALKAGALMCPKCCVVYREVQVDIEFGGSILQDVKVLRCPACEEELFTPEQHKAVMERIRATDESSKANRKPSNR